MSQLDEIGERDGWRCWLCDEAVDRSVPTNDSRGPSIDMCITKAKSKSKSKGGGPVPERLAHRGCNTGKGAVTPVVPWAAHLFVGDPAPILPAVERLERKGGREAFGRCPTNEDADDVAAWLVDRVSRLRPGLSVDPVIEEGGGQYLVLLRAT
ncbi:MAG: hypothetical protein H0U92_14015 [Actinobacteria bacterium]|nr:hypothetical protein [Actinomycetota bacterium]